MLKLWKRVAQSKDIQQKKVVTPLALTMHLSQRLVGDFFATLMDGLLFLNRLMQQKILAYPIVPRLDVNRPV